MRADVTLFQGLLSHRGVWKVPGWISWRLCCLPGRWAATALLLAWSAYSWLEEVAERIFWYLFLHGSDFQDLPVCCRRGGATVISAVAGSSEFFWRGASCPFPLGMVQQLPFPAPTSRQGTSGQHAHRAIKVHRSKPRLSWVRCPEQRPVSDTRASISRPFITLCCRGNCLGRFSAAELPPPKPTSAGGGLSYTWL